jgi:hypothetical protein
VIDEGAIEFPLRLVQIDATGDGNARAAANAATLMHRAADGGGAERNIMAQSGHEGGGRPRSIGRGSIWKSCLPTSSNSERRSSPSRSAQCSTRSIARRGAPVSVRVLARVPSRA